MDGGRAEKLIQIGEEIDKKWEPYALEHLKQSQEAYENQKKIFEDMKVDNEDSTTMNLMSIIYDLDILEEEGQQGLHRAIRHAVHSTKATICGIFQETASLVSEFQKSLQIERQVVLNKISHVCQDIMTQSPDQMVVAQHSSHHHLLSTLEGLSEYSTMFWDLRIHKIIGLLSAHESDLMSQHSVASRELQRISTSHAEYESQIEDAKKSIARQQDNISKLVEDIKCLECERELMEEERQGHVKEIAKIREKLGADKKAHQEKLENISVETNMVMKELERIVAYFESLAGLKE